MADRLHGLREWAHRRRPAGIRVRVTATAVAIVGTASVLAAFVMVGFVGRSLTAQAADQATVRAEQIADGGVRDGRTIVVADPGEQFVQVLRGTTVVASSANVAGLPLLAVPGPESTVRFQIPTVAGPFIAASAVTAGVDGPRTVVVGLNVDDIDDARHVVALALLIGVPMLLVVVGVVTWRMVGRTLRPVEDMREEVERISSTELDRRVPTPSRDDEVGRLARTMNRMLDRLQRAQDRQRRFISDASHELRSPVAAIRQHAEVAAAHPDSTNLRELADVVLAEDARLQELVEDLLVLARLDEHVRRLASLGYVRTSNGSSATSRTTRPTTRTGGSGWALGHRTGTSPSRWTMTVPGSQPPIASGHSSGSCGWTARATARAAGAGSACRSCARSLSHTRARWRWAGAGRAGSARRFGSPFRRIDRSGRGRFASAVNLR